jgi:hypothetical protein
MAPLQQCFKKEVSICCYRQWAVIQALVDEKETVGDTSNISAMFMNVE